MNALERIRQGMRLVFHLGDNWMSVLGAALTTAYGAGLRVSEVAALKMGSPHDLLKTAR